MTQNNNNKLRILIDGSLPWDKQEGEDRRLYGIVIILLILALLMMILVAVSYTHLTLPTNREV